MNMQNNNHIENHRQQPSGETASEERIRAQQVEAATGNMVRSADVIITAAGRVGAVSGNVISVDFGGGASQEQHTPEDSRRALEGFTPPSTSFWQGGEADAAA